MSSSSSSSSLPLGSSALIEWFDALRSGEFTLVQQQFTQYPQFIHAIDPSNNAVGESSSFIVACESGELDILELFLAAGSSMSGELLTRPNSNGETAIMLASENGHTRVLKRLFEFIAQHEDDMDIDFDINQLDAIGASCLFKAARELQVECVEEILKYDQQRVDIEAYNDAGENVLLAVIQAAASNGSGSEQEKEALKILRMIVNYHAQHSTAPCYILNRIHKSTGLTPLLVAIRSQLFSIFEFLVLHSDTDLNKADYDGLTPLMYCVLEEELGDEYGKCLLQKSGDNRCDLSRQNKKGYTAFHLAIREQNDSIVQLLMAHLAATPAAARSNQLTDAASSSSTFSSSHVCSILDGEFGWTPLQHACVNNLASYVQSYCQHRLPCNATDRRGATALHIAARFGHLMCVRYLLQHLSDSSLETFLNTPDLSGNTPVVDAAVNGHIQVVELLQEKGASLQTTDVRGNNILHKLVMKLIDGKTQSTVRSSIVMILKNLFDKPSTTASSSSSSSSLLTLLHARNLDSFTPLTLVESDSTLASNDVAAIFIGALSKSPPEPPVIASTHTNGTEVVVFFEIPDNYKRMTLEGKYKYKVTCKLVDDGSGDTDGNEEVSLTRSIKKVSKSSTKEKEKESGDDVVEKKSGTTKKATTTSSSTSSAVSTKKASASTKKTSSSSSSSSTASTKKSSVTSSSSSVRSTAASSVSSTSSSSSISATGTSSPIRIPDLQPGKRYIITMRTIDSHKQQSATSSRHPVPVLVGPPAPPTITSIQVGRDWMTVYFMPSTSGATTTTNHSSANSTHEHLARVHEFTLHASFNGTLVKRVSCVASPVTLVLTPPPTSSSALVYSVAMTATNGYGEGMHTLSKSVQLVEEGGPQSRVRPSTAMPGKERTSGQQQQSSPAVAGALIPLSSAIDSHELNEASSIFYSLLSTELASHLSTGSIPSSPSVSSIHRLENGSLRREFDRATDFMLALDCTRHEATRTEWASLVGATRASVEQIARYGVLPFTHPMSHAYVAGSTCDSDYNRNQYPAGSPFRGSTLLTQITKRALMLSKANVSSPSSNDDNDSYDLVLCKILPGRSRSVGSSDTVQPSTSFDSSRSSTSILLHSSSQVLPVYSLTVRIPSSVPTSVSSPLVANDGELTLEDVLEADARAQVLDVENGDNTRPESAPVRSNGRSDVGNGTFGRGKLRLGAAPSSSIEPPMGGQAPSYDYAAASNQTPTPSTPSRRGAYDDDMDDEPERLDINKAQSSLLGPATGPTTSKKTSTAKR